MSGPTFIDLVELSERLGRPINRVHQLIRERQLLGVRSEGILRVPEEFVIDGDVVRGLPGTINVLTDAGYSDAEILSWLYADDDSLPGRPIDALRENRGTEVRRRAQAAGF
jgi:hypothetical protein